MAVSTICWSLISLCFSVSRIYITCRSLLSLASIRIMEPLIKNMQKLTAGIRPAMPLPCMLIASAGKPKQVIEANRNTAPVAK